MTDIRKGPEGFENLTPEEKNALEKQLAEMRQKREKIVSEQKTKTEPEIAENFVGGEAVIEEPVIEEPEVEYVEAEEIKDEELKKAKIEEYKKEIDLLDPNSIRRYGAQDQAGMQSITNDLENRKVGTIKEVGEKMTQLLEDIKISSEKTQPKTGIQSLPIVRKFAKIVRKKMNERKTLEDCIKEMEDYVEKTKGGLESDIESIKETMKTCGVTYYELDLRIRALELSINEMEQELIEKKKICKDAFEMQEISVIESNLNVARKRQQSLEIQKHMAIQAAINLKTMSDANLNLLSMMDTIIADYIPQIRMDLVQSVMLDNTESASEMATKIMGATNDFYEQISQKTKDIAIKVAKQCEASLIDISKIEKGYRLIAETQASLARIAIEGEKSHAEGLKRLEQMSEQVRIAGGGIQLDQKQLK